MGQNHNKNNCLLCGEELVYFDPARQMECAVCHRPFESNVCCADGHYICDECHSSDAVGVIVETCLHTASRDPIAIMTALMEQPCVHMHGPEHHVLVGAALLAACRNSGADIDLAAAVPEMRRRGGQVPGGACGNWGCCGAAVSTGIFVSLLTGATPLKTEEWGLANRMTAAALDAIGSLGGPRCCKRDAFTAVCTAAAFVKEHFGISMEVPGEICCGFSHLNAQCIGARCPYNPCHFEKK
ncbi:MAG: SAM-dependent methyltransferase [Ruminococcaceae bacterium]|nr:SAM-dependent methyltransferase [Oscillospiraceae bacterium]